MTSYERLKKALEQNKDSFELDDDGVICVKEEAIAAAIKRFKDEFDGF
ncbi:hypothetical protein P4Y30_004464 [Salmonella enterica]|nr:hypothetical protein [Salmonella enterica]EKQ3116066.1 hypothetical protein [Salmonella enterica]